MKVQDKKPGCQEISSFLLLFKSQILSMMKNRMLHTNKCVVYLTICKKYNICNHTTYLKN